MSALLERRRRDRWDQVLVAGLMLIATVSCVVPARAQAIDPALGKTKTMRAIAGTPVLMVWLHYWKRPGCTPERLRSVKITVPPRQGRVEIRDESWLLSTVNLDKADECGKPFAGKAIYYIPKDGFEGREAVTVEVIRADGKVEKFTSFISVEPPRVVQVPADTAKPIAQFFRFGPNCNPRPAPTLIPLKSPEGGTLSFTAVERIHTDTPGNQDFPCVGKRVPAMTVTFTPKPGFRGRELLEYSVIHAWSPPLYGSIAVQVGGDVSVAEPARPANGPQPTRVNDSPVVTATPPGESVFVGPLPAPVADPKF